MLKTVVTLRFFSFLKQPFLKKRIFKIRSFKFFAMTFKRFSFFCTFLLVFFSFSCDNDTDQQVEDLQALVDFQNEIVTLANTSVCGESLDFECRATALGSNSCGGPLAFVLYSTSIDTDAIEQMIVDYNQQQLEYNQRYDVVVSCIAVPTPGFIGCIEGQCAIQG